MSMRFATAMDIGAIMDLHGRCFGSSPAFMKIYYQQIFRPEQTLVFTEGEHVRSSLQMLAVRGKLNRKDIKGGLLYAGMTDPDAQGVSVLVFQGDGGVAEGGFWQHGFSPGVRP